MTTHTRKFGNMMREVMLDAYGLRLLINDCLLYLSRVPTHLLPYKIETDPRKALVRLPVSFHVAVAGIKTVPTFPRK